MVEEIINHHQYTQIVILGGSFICCALLICELLRKRKCIFTDHQHTQTEEISQRVEGKSDKNASKFGSHITTTKSQELEFTGIRNRKSRKQTLQHCDCCSKLNLPGSFLQDVCLSEDNGISDSEFRNGLGYNLAASMSRGRGQMVHRNKLANGTTVGQSMSVTHNSDNDVRPLQTSTPLASAPVPLIDHSSQTDCSGGYFAMSTTVHNVLEDKHKCRVNLSGSPSKDLETTLVPDAKKAGSNERVLCTGEELEVELINQSVSTLHLQKSRRRKKRKGRQENPVHSNQENKLPKESHISRQGDLDHEKVTRNQMLKDVLINKENVIKCDTVTTPMFETEVIPPISKQLLQRRLDRRHDKAPFTGASQLNTSTAIDCQKSEMMGNCKPLEMNMAHDSLDSGVDLSQNVSQYQLGLRDHAAFSVSSSPTLLCSTSSSQPISMQNTATSTIDMKISTNSANNPPMLVSRGMETCATATRSTGTAMVPAVHKTIGTCTPPTRMRRSVNGLQTESRGCGTDADDTVANYNYGMKSTKSDKGQSLSCCMPVSAVSQGSIEWQPEAKNAVPLHSDWLPHEDVNVIQKTYAETLILPASRPATVTSHKPSVDPICEELNADKMDLQSLHSCSDQVIDSLSRLGLNCSSVSSSFDNWVVSLQDLPESKEILCKKKGMLDLEWSLARRLYLCIEIHIKNASDYQKFMHSTAVLQGKIVQLQRRVETLSKVPPSSVCVNRDFLLCHLAEINEVVKEALKNSNSIQELYELSSSIHPVNKRVEPVSQPVKVEMICPFSDGSVELSVGDKLFLMDNSSPKKWRLKYGEEGLEVNIPAVAVLIQPPDHQSIEAVQRLIVQMNAVWKTHGDAWTVRVMWLTLLVLQDIASSQECKSASCQETDTLLRSLSVLDGVLSLADSSDSRDDILQQVYQIRDVLLENRSKESSSNAGSCPLTLRMMSQLADIYSALQVEPSGRCGLQLLVDGHDDRPDAEEQPLTDEHAESMSSESSHVPTMPVEVSVEHQHETAQASSIRASLQEVRQTFAIGAVLDPVIERFISVQEAIEMGIIDSTSGTYRNINSGTTLPIPEAMSRGLILVEGTKTMATREQSASMGVLTVTVTRETRPYTVCRVLHPITEQMISVQEAIQAGIFSPATGTYINTETDEELDVEAAIDSGLLLVNYDELIPRGDPFVTKKCFAVYSVTDRSANVRLTFSQAEKRGIIDAETGYFTDNMSYQTMHLSEALRKGYVRARAFADMDSLEIWVARRAGRRGSTASSLSTLSGWSQASSELMARADRN